MKKPLKNKISDFDWTHDISSDYWDYHNVLVFDEFISFIEFDDLISYALFSNEPKNWKQWNYDGKKEAWNYLTHLVKSYGVGYLIWDKPYLAVSAEVTSLKDPKLINYGDTIGDTNKKHKLKESSDFDWVEDEINEPIRFRNGDKIRVINIGDTESYIDFLGTYGKTYRTGKFGYNIEGEVVEVENNQHLFALREKNSRQLLFFPWLDKIDHWNRGYPNLNVKYEFIDDDLNESNDFEWVKDVEPPNLDFSFDGKEHWVDVSKIDREGRKKIVNYIKKTVPNYEEFEHDVLGHISRGNYEGIIIHCGSQRTDYEPEENLLCSGLSDYEDDYKIDNPYSNMSKSLYYDGQEILDYITVVGDEELDESLEWSDKDVPFDEKDKSFESDPSWKDDEDWSLNPERSYWKQGDTGGSGGGDVNESNELEWISNTRPTLKDVFDENLIEVGDILTLSGVLSDGDQMNNQWVEDFKVKIVSVSHKGGLSSTYFTPLQKKYWDFLGYDGTGDVRFVKKDGDLQLEGRINSKDVVEESNDWDWVKDIPGTKEFDQKYRYFEILTCYSIDYESEECDDEHSHFVKIPKHEADKFWVDEVIDDLDMDILAGPVDDGEGVIMYAIQNRLISHFDINEIIMFEGVRELDKNTYDKLTNYRDSEIVESNDFDWVKDVKPNWGTYYGGIIMKDIEDLPKNLEDVTSEMLSPIWMKIETINRQILTRKNRDNEHDVSETLFESMGQIEWLFGRIMALVDGETDSLVSSRMEPQEYYNSRKLTIISYIKGMTKQLELLGESEEWEWAKEIVSDKTSSKYYIIDKRSQKGWGRLHDKDEWFLIEVVDRDDVTTMWRSYAFNVKDVASWAPSLSISKMSTKEFNNLLGLNNDGTPNLDKIPYWIPHDGDLRGLPKNHNYKKMSELNESSEFKDFNWISKISSDDYEPNTGDHIEIVNQGKPHLFKNWLSPTIWMDYNMGKITNSDGNIEGVVQNDFPFQDEKDNFVVKIKGTKNEYIFLPKRYKIKQIKEKSRDPEWYGLDIVYKPIKISSELREDSNNYKDWSWAKGIKPKFTKLTSNIYQYGGSLPEIKIVFKRVEDGEIKTTVIEFDEYNFIESSDYLNRHFYLIGVDEEGEDWIVDGIAYSMGGGEYEWDVNWESLENNS